MAAHYHIFLTGLVQGVGFRPFVYQLACSHGIVGTVYNDCGGVVVDCCCSPEVVQLFTSDIRLKAPDAATIDSLMVVKAADGCSFVDFSVSPSRTLSGSSVYVSPDLALCSVCRAELVDPKNRRFSHPLINCTACGSRYSIITATPYDRVATSMAQFPLCKQCHNEYTAPDDRRFHAEPICCPKCGPRCVLKGKSVSSSELAACGSLLSSGLVGAIKGVGGFQICCDAADGSAVARIRSFKQRPTKPFAVMARSMADIHELCIVSPAEQALLVSAPGPIVLLRLQRPELVSAGVCGTYSHIGVMLPTTGLHHLLFSASGLPFLLMTSANPSGVPLITEVQRLKDDLATLFDFYIDHDRPILNRIDDSVAMVVDEEVCLVRRARGYVPRPLLVPLAVDKILALGGQQKNSFAIGRGEEAFLGPHIGTLGYLESNQFLKDAISTYRSILQLHFDTVVHDLHPAYETTKMAAEFHVQTIGVQHHHAHHASCMAEHGLQEPCLGLILDGSGYGDDGTIWGGEMLLADFGGYTRVGHFETVPLLGGEKAVQYPFRMALSYLAEFMDGEDLQRYFSGEATFGQVYALLLSGNSLLTSSCGRLFDAVAYLLGCGQEVTYEGEAAICLEHLAEKSQSGAVYSRVLDVEIGEVLPTISLVEAVYNDVQRGRSVVDASRIFFNTLITLLVNSVTQAGGDSGVEKILLSGGVFQNRILSTGCEVGLSKAGFQCFRQRKVPCNDGGLALGQLCIAAARLNTESQGSSS